MWEGRIVSDALVLFGFSWMVIGALIGFYVGHQHDPNLKRLEEIAERGSLLEYHRTLDAYKWKVTIHAHSLLFPLVAITIGLVMPRLGFPETGNTILGFALMAAGPLWTVGAARSFMPIMALGDILLLGSIAGTAYGLARVF